MIRIGDFSKLSHLTVKTLRFYEKEGLLIPQSTDKWTGYRMYETCQLARAARIRAFRQLGLSVAEIRDILNGADERDILTARAEMLRLQIKEMDKCLSVIHHILEEDNMKYQVTVKTIPQTTVYSAEVRIGGYSDMMQVIPAIGEECLKLNPGLKCAVPPYEFCEYLDGEHKESDILIRHNEAVEHAGKEGGRITFRTIPETKVLSVFYKGGYDGIGEAYAYIMKYAEENGYTVTGLSRECYIDGIWNKESEDEWLTEIQLPIA